MKNLYLKFDINFKCSLRISSFIFFSPGRGANSRTDDTNEVVSTAMLGFDIKFLPPFLYLLSLPPNFVIKFLYEHFCKVG